MTLASPRRCWNVRDVANCDTIVYKRPDDDDHDAGDDVNEDWGEELDEDENNDKPDRDGHEDVDEDDFILSSASDSIRHPSVPSPGS